MRNILLILFLGLSGHLLIGQSTFSWGLNLYPNLSDRRLVNTGGLLSDKAMAEIDKIEKTQFGYAVGLDMQWQAEKIGLNLGLRYMNAGYNIGRTILLPDDPNVDFADESSGRFEQTRLELPVEVLFFFNLSDEDAIFFTMGASFGYTLQTKNELTLYRNNNPETSLIDPEYPVRDFNYAFQTGVGWQTQLNNKLQLSIQPNFQFWFKGIYEDEALINRNLFNFGVKLGLRFFQIRE